jgi:hypothetical protein
MREAHQATRAQARSGKSLVPNVICAELIGSDTACAAGISVTAYTPVLELCRRLVVAGHDPATPLKAYRGRTLCLIVQSIGIAAALEINARGNGFRLRRAADAAPPIARKRRPIPRAVSAGGHAISADTDDRAAPVPAASTSPATESALSPSPTRSMPARLPKSARAAAKLPSALFPVTDRTQTRLRSSDAQDRKSHGPNKAVVEPSRRPAATRVPETLYRAKPKRANRR